MSFKVPDVGIEHGRGGLLPSCAASVAPYVLISQYFGMASPDAERERECQILRMYDHGSRTFCLHARLVVFSETPQWLLHETGFWMDFVCLSHPDFTYVPISQDN